MDKLEKENTKSILGASIGCVALVIAALITAFCGPAALRLLDRTPTPLPTITPTDFPTEAPLEADEETSPFRIEQKQLAVFYLQFPEGTWSPGQTYRYILQVQKCNHDNFKSDPPITFDASTQLGQTFFLLDDGLYDHYDKNDAQRIEHGSFIDKSNAIVVIPKDTSEEAEKVLASCRASIIINNSPPIPLQPNREGVVLTDDNGAFYIDANAIPEIQIFP